ncbi:LOW QUALITY PROTEIN: dual specificity protein phosphatase 8 [Salarias fasciatus]|uniref:LOW QUALITY PROTEIN: dual specificity protein phosphatase 8 n=1 Tax=Salarias fasciatus TaxID=181472 RepID=UPI003F586436
MVWSQEREAERPPLSVILPRLYLGAERDVTQEQLASLGISYVLSVSRCSPQPPFLPCSRFLRIPIDDSLWADLLPWIPQALSFIDAAMSSGSSVLVHCAAGISRSPALAVAYIMYRLDLDLDQAYRFVKERRPSISPNFNFLGQLQHFQATLSQKASGGAPLHPGAGGAGGGAPRRQADPPHTDGGSEDSALQRLELTDVNGNRPALAPQVPEALQVPQTPEPAAPSPPAPKPPSCSASLREKRKSLTLSLSPVGVSPPSPADTERPPREGRQTGGAPRAPHRAPPSQCSRAEAKEAGLLSPFSLTLNKLIGWGERVLLGGVFLPPVRMGQPALPYRC